MRRSSWWSPRRRIGSSKITGRPAIGFHDSYAEYINKLAQVWRECWRVLQPGCRMCINVGDYFAREQKNRNHDRNQP